MSRKIFVNLPTKDLGKATEFYAALGFGINEDFSNEQASCVVISDDIYLMVVTEDFFSTIVTKGIADQGTEAVLALSSDSKADVDELAEKALAAGAQKANDPADEGFMYSRSFLDLDGHHWEVLWMDMDAAVPEA